MAEKDQLDMEALAKFERDIENLKRDYEQYFMGMTRLPPEREHTRLQGVVRKYRNAFNPNTMVKFKLETMVAKFQSYSRYWTRVMREIEEGRYKRDVFKANLRVGSSPTPTSRPETSTAEPGLDQQIDKLYKDYMTARIECNQPTKGMSREKLKQSIEKSLPQLKQKYKGRNIEFRVVVEGGKAKLKALPK